MRRAPPLAAAILFIAGRLPASEVRLEVAVDHPSASFFAPAGTTRWSIPALRWAETSPPSTVNESLAQAPALFAGERAPLGYGIGPSGSGGYTLRGFNTGQRSLVVIDGRPDAMGIFGHPLYDAYGTETVEHVELAPGADAVRFGPGAMGGTVRMESRHRRIEGLGQRVEVSAGSYGRRDGVLSHGWRRGTWDHYLSVANRHSDGHRPKSAADSSTYYGSFGWRPADGHEFRLAVRHNNTSTQDPGTMTEAHLATLSKWSRAKRTGLDLSYERGDAHESTRLASFLNYGENTIRNLSTTQYYWDSIDRTYGLSATERLSLREGLSAEFGLEHKDAGGGGRNITRSLAYPDRSFNEQGVFAQARFEPAEPVALSAGARGQRHQLYGLFLAPQAGAEYTLPTRTTLRACVGRAFRPPTVYEQFHKDPAVVDLGLERSWEYSAGISHRLAERAEFSATAYITEGENLLRNAGTAAVPKYRSSDRFIHRGVEATGSASISPSWDLLAGAAFMDPASETRSAPHRRFTLAPRLRLGRFSGEVGVERVDQLFGSDGKLDRLRDYTRVSLKTQFRPVERLRLFAEADNLLDQRYQVLNGYDMPGINALAGFSMDF